jgi:diphthamide synthase (EF-2-diphthine--ammonia ligase)
LDASWLGRIVDERFVTDIASVDVDACGENGEYHTFAFAGPVFAKPLAWMRGAVRNDGDFAQLDLTDA